MLRLPTLRYTRRAPEVVCLPRIGLAYWLTIHRLVLREVALWKRRAATIPDGELRALAIGKLTAERLNPEGAALFAVLAPSSNRATLVRLLVAYQILYDYLDAVNEQQGSMTLRNGLQLHRALADVFVQDTHFGDYYAHNPSRNDGRYVLGLVQRCHSLYWSMPGAPRSATLLEHAAERCGKTQAHNHAVPLEGEDGLRVLAESFGDAYLWWELAAAGISCLAIHALLAHAADSHGTMGDAERIDTAYFPAVCAFSALLDSLSDHYRDVGTENHSFTTHYRDPVYAAERFTGIALAARGGLRALPRASRHSIILDGIAAFYLSSRDSWLEFTAPVARQTLDSLGHAAGGMRAVMLVRRWVTNAR